MEKSLKSVLFLISIGCIIVIVSGQVVNPTKRYCFNFSWLGPKYNNESTTTNQTCEDITMLSNNIPCKLPLVITEDGTYPDMDFLWENHDADVSCLLVEGEVCAKYIYRSDGFIQNVTFMCTKVYTDTDKTENSGCYVAKKGSREVEVCMCRTAAPGSIPCNRSPSVIGPSVIYILLVSFIVGVSANYVLETD